MKDDIRKRRDAISYSSESSSLSYDVKKRKKKSRNDEISYSSDSSSYERRVKKRKKKHRNSKSHKKRLKKNDRRCKDVVISSKNETWDFVDSIYHLFESYPDMVSDLMSMLFKMVSSDTTFNLSQMPDKEAVNSLEDVFVSLKSYGIFKMNDSWGWKNKLGIHSKDEFFLLKVCKKMLDEVGITMNSVEEFEHNFKESSERSQIESKPNETQKIDSVMMTILVKFKDKLDVLAHEIIGLCQVILEGEVVSLVGIPDEILRKELENLFEIVGLELVQMEEDIEENESISMGYGLPDDDNAQKAAKNLKIAIVSCQNILKVDNATTLKKPNVIPTVEDSDDEIGPSLPRSNKILGPSLPHEVVETMAKARKKSLLNLKEPGSEVREGQRETWMLEPGQHELLKGLKSIKGRKFKNEKTSTKQHQQPKFDPETQAKLDQILQASHAARGPSLMEQYQQKKKEKEKKTLYDESANKWKWNREKHLDSGRRVDKNALKMVLGGDGLKSKFQHSYFN